MAAVGLGRGRGAAACRQCRGRPVQCRRGRHPGRRAARRQPAKLAARNDRDAEPRDGDRPPGRQGRSGRAAAPDLVIWPENSTDQDPRRNPYIYQLISGTVAAIDRPVLVGAVLQDPVRNAGQLWLPGKGPVATYVKRRLVPFGEVIPFRGLLDKFTSLPLLQPVDFTPGHQAVVFSVGKIRLGDVICYEVGFDGLVSSEVAAGANLLAVQTNDADFELDGQTGETLQQLAMARIRAIEHDRAVVVASTTGISAIIAPDGSLLASTGRGGRPRSRRGYRYATPRRWRTGSAAGPRESSHSRRWPRWPSR